MLGITEEYTHFDADIIMHINSVFVILNQLGVGPDVVYRIDDKDDMWADFMADDPQLEMVKSYMFLKVRMLFDPPQSSAVMESMKNMINEFEWRLNVAAELKLSAGGEEIQNG
jgi:hypothetical protein